MPSQAAAQALRKLGIDVEEAVNMSLYNQSQDGLERYILYLADWNENDIGKSPVRQVVVCPQWRTPEDHNLFAEIPHDALVLLHLPSGVVITFSIDRWGIFQMLYHWAPSIVRFATL
jgi:hypothetical protein